MGRRHKHKPKRTRPPDPDRDRRIHDQRRKEQALRESLDRLLKLGKELGDRIHYDKLSEERLSLLTPLAEEIKLALEQRLEVVADCGLAQYGLTRECEILEERLKSADGSPTTDLLAGMEDDLARLPPKQANGLRLIAALDKAKHSSPKPLDEVRKPLERASRFHEALDHKVRTLCQLATEMIEIAAERVRRGWLPPEKLEALRPLAEKLHRDLAAAVEQQKATLDDYLAASESLITRREGLLTRLSKLPPGK
jgi:hypothetical protein